MSLIFNYFGYSLPVLLFNNSFYYVCISGIIVSTVMSIYSLTVLIQYLHLKKINKNKKTNNNNNKFYTISPYLPKIILS